MKRYIRASWIPAEVLEDEDLDIEELWQDYLCDAEERVNAKMQVFIEPSVQMGVGEIAIFDESSEDRFDPVYVDFQKWSDAEFEMAAESGSEEEYAQKYADYLVRTIGLE